MAFQERNCDDSRPGGLRNSNEEDQTDQRMLFTGDKRTHGYQTMSALSRNGILAMSPSTA